MGLTVQTRVVRPAFPCSFLLNIILNPGNKMANYKKKKSSQESTVISHLPREIRDNKQNQQEEISHKYLA
jgi:hypothetical protein